MLSALCGVFAMTPIIFGIAGYVMVSRDGARTPELLTAKDIDLLKHSKESS
jgi:hypothetical protein